MVVRQRFVNEGGGAAVTAAVHISGPHANFISRGTDSFEKGLLGPYSEITGLTSWLPETLQGSVLDTPSVEVILKDAALRYFNQSAGFFIPAGSRNTVAAADPAFSFAEYGDTLRHADLHARDVKVGDHVRLTTVVGGVEESFWTSVARLLPHYEASEIDPVVGLGANAAAVGADMATVPAGYDTTGFNPTLTLSPGMGDNLLAKGSANAVYTVEVVSGGDIDTARFRVVASNGDNLYGVKAERVTLGDDTKCEIELGTIGLTLTYEDVTDLVFAVGMFTSVQVAAQYTPSVLTAGGMYTAPATNKAPKETIYTVTVTRGGSVPAAGSPASDYECAILSVTTNTGIDGASRVLVKEAGTIGFGRYGIQIAVPEGYLSLGDRYFITARTQYAKRLPYIGLRDNIPNHWVSASDISLMPLELFISKPEAVVPALSVDPLSGSATANWAIENRAVQVFANLTLTDPSWTVFGDVAPLPVIANAKTKAYLTGRYFVSDLVGMVTQVTTAEELDEIVSGPVDPSNPLKYAAFHTLAGGDGSQVLLTAVADPSSLEEWERVTDLISARDDVFHVFPLCYGDKQVTDLFYRHIREMNQDEAAKERLLYLIDYTPDYLLLAQGTEETPYEGRLSLETDTSSLQYLAFTSDTSEIDFIQLGVRAGDVIHANPVYNAAGNLVWSTYPIAEVINAATVRLAIAPTTVDPTPAVFEVWRNQTSREKSEIIASTAGIQDMLVRYLLVDNLDKAVDPIGPASTFVGLIGSVVPHQGVSWYPLSGWSGDGWQGQFSNAEMNHMAGNGVTILTRHGDGYISARHSVTTAKAPLAGQPETALSLKLSEEMYVRNALLLKKEFRGALRGFVGVTNLVQGTTTAIEANLVATARFLQSDNDYPTLGGRILSELQDLEIRRHILHRDHLIVSFKVECPFALNTLDCTIYV